MDQCESNWSGFGTIQCEESLCKRGQPPRHLLAVADSSDRRRTDGSVGRNECSISNLQLPRCAWITGVVNFQHRLWSCDTNTRGTNGNGNFKQVVVFINFLFQVVRIDSDGNCLVAFVYRSPVPRCPANHSGAQIKLNFSQILGSCNRLNSQTIG